MQAIFETYDKVKEHIKQHKEAYIVGAAGIGLATITWLITRGNTSQSINRGIPVVANGGIPVVGKKIAIGSISYISADRQGSPSWVVRCKETGNIFTSQRSAALEMELPASEISRHLNGILENVRGFTFERICMAA
jgi:hypothetical protein